jgi:hypothetical protein
MALIVICGLLIYNVAGSSYYDLLKQPNASVTAPPVILENGSTGDNTIYANSTSAKVSVQENHTLELWVDSFDNSSVVWTEIGTSPYLSSVNYPTDYITTSVSAIEDRFNFTDTSESGTINDVEICVYTQQDAGDDGELQIWLHNSTSTVQIASFVTASSWTWYNYSCLSTLSTWTEINDSGLRLEAVKIGGVDVQYVDAALLFVNYTRDNFDSVLEVNNTVAGSWQIRLKKYADSNINRLENCTVYFHNSTDGTSAQIEIENGDYKLGGDVGSWYNLDPLETIYVAMTIDTSSTGTSYVNTYLEILTPGTSTYVQYVITFEIT